jgi:hypothetical protein
MRLQSPLARHGPASRGRLNGSANDRDEDVSIAGVRGPLVSRAVAPGLDVMQDLADHRGIRDIGDPAQSAAALGASGVSIWNTRRRRSAHVMGAIGRPSSFSVGGARHAIQSVVPPGNPERFSTSHSADLESTGY